MASLHDLNTKYHVRYSTTRSSYIDRDNDGSQRNEDAAYDGQNKITSNLHGWFKPQQQDIPEPRINAWFKTK